MNYFLKRAALALVSSLIATAVLSTNTSAAHTLADWVGQNNKNST